MSIPLFRGETLVLPFHAVTALSEMRTRLVVEDGVKYEMCDNWYHCKCQGVSNALYAALQETVVQEERNSPVYIGTVRDATELV